MSKLNEEKLNKILELKTKRDEIDNELEKLLSTEVVENVSLSEKPNRWNTLKMKPEYTVQYLVDECKKLFDTYVYSWVDLSKTKSDRSGEYEITYEPNVEADEKWKNKSANDLAELKDIKFITLEERLLLEIQYFKETGKHLDVDNWTFCSGSRLHCGRVPRCGWDEYRFQVDDYHPDSADDYMRTRNAI